jgi:hypothetical protein
MLEIIYAIGADAINLGVVEATTQEMFNKQVEIVLNNDSETAMKLLGELE